MARERKTAGGSGRMRELGMRKVEVWLMEEEAALVMAAAIRCGQKVATWVRTVAYHAAQKSASEAEDRRRPAY